MPKSNEDVVVAGKSRSTLHVNPLLEGDFFGGGIDYNIDYHVLVRFIDRQ